MQFAHYWVPWLSMRFGQQKNAMCKEAYFLVELGLLNFHFYQETCKMPITVTIEECTEREDLQVAGDPWRHCVSLCTLHTEKEKF